MAKIERKNLYELSGGIYDHETRSIEVDTKEGYVSRSLDEIFTEEFDGYEIKIVATKTTTEE